MAENQHTIFKTRNSDNNTNIIRIYFSDGGFVSGFLLEPLGMAADAKYDTFFNFDGKLGLLGEILGFAGGIQFGKAGFWTRQYYKGGSYIKVDGKMRIVNWTSDDIVLDSIETLISRCMPTQSISEDIAKSNLIGAANLQTSKNQLPNSPVPLKEGETLESRQEALNAESAKNKFMGFIKEVGQKGIKIIDDAVTGSPSRATISTNYINLPDMVLKSVNCVPSKELLDNGYPLYADIDFSFEQREIKTQGDIRSMIGSKKPRVSVE